MWALKHRHPHPLVRKETWKMHLGAPTGSLQSASWSYVFMGLPSFVNRVKSSLCLIKHHAMQIYWRDEPGGKDPRINFGIREK
jgi:hypothetical protein